MNHYMTKLSVIVPTVWWRLRTINTFQMELYELLSDVVTDLDDFEYTVTRPIITYKDALTFDRIEPGYLTFESEEEAVRFTLKWGETIAAGKLPWQR